MDYIIDTNIAYYLIGYQNSHDKNFLINKFREDKNSKLITSLSLLEIFRKVKKDPKQFKLLMTTLEKENIGTLIYGDLLKDNEKITIKKLAHKPSGYVNRIMNYINDAYANELATNIIYLGFLIGSMYAGLLELRDNHSIKLKDYQFTFLSLKTKENELRKIIIKDINECYYNKKNNLEIFGHIRCLIIMAISDYECKNYSSSEKEKINAKIEQYNKNKAIDINCPQLMNFVCKTRNYKSSLILKKYYECLGNSSLDFSCLKYIVKNIFTKNKFEFNDFADSTIISVGEKIKETDAAVLTSDINWKDFLFENSSINNFAYRSKEAIEKFYINK